MIQRYDCTNGGAQFCQGCYTMTPDTDGEYVTYADHLAALAAKDAEIEALKLSLVRAAGWTEHDQQLPEDDAILAAFPVGTNREARRFAIYAEAQRLVSAKRSKGALVDLVNWLLARAERAEKAEAELAALRADRDSWAEQASDRLKDWDEIRQQCEALRADAERWRTVSAMMTHEHRADAVGWTLGALLPGDDPDAAIDAARAGGEG